jgi:hypothetical protein
MKYRLGAVQVAFEKQTLNNQVFTSQAQGLKPGAFKLWVDLIQLVPPPPPGQERLGVAVQVAFESEGLKPVFSLHRLEG